MTVKELMEKLAKCNPDAIVCVEANRNPLANEVQEYELVNGTHHLYIADELDYIDDVILGKRVYVDDFMSDLRMEQCEQM